MPSGLWPYPLTEDKQQTAETMKVNECDSCSQSSVQQRDALNQHEYDCKEQRKSPCDQPPNQFDEGKEIELPGDMGTITEKDVDEFVDSLLLKAKIKKMQRQETRVNTYSDVACNPCRTDGGPTRRASDVGRSSAPAPNFFTVGERKNAHLASNDSPLLIEA